MKIFSKAMLGVPGLFLMTALSATADIMWTFDDVTFNDGNQLTGTFTTDSAITTIESFNVAVTGADTAADFTAAQMVDAYLPSEIGIANSDFSIYTDLYLTSPLTSSGGKVTISSGYDCPGCGVLINNADTGITGVVTTPEPAAIVLVSVGGMLLGIAWRRKWIYAQ